MERDEGGVEQPGLEPGAVVLDGECGPPVLRVRIDTDGAAVGRVPDGVVDQIVERLPSPCRIEAHAGVGVTIEWSRLEAGVIDEKAYIPGVGPVREIAVQGPPESARLVRYHRGS